MFRHRPPRLAQNGCLAESMPGSAILGAPKSLVAYSASDSRDTLHGFPDAKQTMLLCAQGKISGIRDPHMAFGRWPVFRKQASPKVVDGPTKLTGEQTRGRWRNERHAGATKDRNTADRYQPVSSGLGGARVICFARVRQGKKILPDRTLGLRTRSSLFHQRL